jgi:hypothetical protein
LIIEFYLKTSHSPAADFPFGSPAEYNGGDGLDPFKSQEA